MIITYPVKIEVAKFNDKWGIWFKLNDGGHIGCIFVTSTKELAIMIAKEIAKIFNAEVEVM
ncbi:hypothetical protein DRQ29_00375 [bacterium]|nr:MAG: hypothetical protein DRQ29_00375 [bacterium]